MGLISLQLSGQVFSYVMLFLEFLCRLQVRGVLVLFFDIRVIDMYGFYFLVIKDGRDFFMMQIFGYFYIKFQSFLYVLEKGI